jgi:hypothetical protein
MAQQTKSPVKTWTKPELNRLGKLQDVRANQNVLVQTGNSKT